jgi:hypothetical protein
MYRPDSLHVMATTRIECGRLSAEATPPAKAPQPADAAGRCRQACRDYEATRLILAALGRRRGPLD